MIWPWALVVRRRQGTVSCIPRPPFFLLPPISSGERVGFMAVCCQKGCKCFHLAKKQDKYVH